MVVVFFFVMLDLYLVFIALMLLSNYLVEHAGFVFVCCVLCVPVVSSGF